MSAIASFLSDLPSTWKALTALGAALAIGFSASLPMLGGQVRENTAAIEVVTDSVASVRQRQVATDRKLDRAICLIELTLMDLDLDPLEVNRRCP